jgi:tetratricopeptide (TPR) repeat protein
MIQLYLWAILWIWDSVSNLPAGAINNAKIAAERAFEAQDYVAAAEFYKQVSDASLFSDPAARLNRAHALYLGGKVEEAQRQYRILTRVADPKLAAQAKSQLGKIALSKGDTVDALHRLREAILLDWRNKSIIADFEILRYRYSGEMHEVRGQTASNEREGAPSPVEESPAQPEPLSNASVERTDQREALLQNLDKINMSEEQAKSILDAMKVNERQYIYQLRRLGARNGTKPSHKIEW